MRFSITNPQRAHVSADLLSAYLDNQATAAERARVDAHLATCAACRTELDSLRQTVALVRALPRVAVPRAFTLSEARVGIRRPATQPGWFGGALRGLVAATAVALVVVVAGTLLRQIGSRPTGQLALAPAATAAPAALSSEAGPAAAPKPMMAAPPQPTAAPTVAVEKVVEMPSQAPAPAAVKPQALAPRPTPAPAIIPTPTTAPAAKAAAPVAPIPGKPTTAAAAPTATAAVMAAAAAATTAPARAMPAADLGAREGGGANQAALTPEAAPAPAAITATLPAGAGVAYADLKGLWTLDRETGARQIVSGEGISSPAISLDRAWIAYRVLRGDHFELWAVRWDGKDARLLLAERDLPKDDLAAGYSERRFGDVRWIPGAATLALNVTVIPTAGDVPPTFELWMVDARTGARRLAVKMDAAARPIFSPDGQRFALLQPATEKTREGSLAIYNADGTAGRVLLKFARGLAPRFYETQASWLPDGKTLLAAVTDPADSPEQLNGITLYRIGADGQAKSAGHVDAFDSFWSPDGTRLAYTRAVNNSVDTRELWIANADGTNPRQYAMLRNGVFVNWSPDNVHFIYADANQVYLGGISQAPRCMGNAASVFDPRWIGPGQFVHLHDQNTGWMLVSRTVNDQAASLLLLPREATYDVTRP
ncbi:MAG: zf-HC2 domain-containing protein [Chloroflexi bacterium]|nr:zf-HC2 domain-containing protein [Chloroflexota bacterium]